MRRGRALSRVRASHPTRAALERYEAEASVPRRDLLTTTLGTPRVTTTHGTPRRAGIMLTRSSSPPTVVVLTVAALACCLRAALSSLVANSKPNFVVLFVEVSESACTKHIVSSRQQPLGSWFVSGRLLRHHEVAGHCKSASPSGRCHY